MATVATECCITAILVWAIIATCFRGAAPEVASSVSAMTSLIAKEDNLIQHFRKVMDLVTKVGGNITWIRKLKRRLECIEIKHDVIARMSSSLRHPIVAFRLIRRLVKDWDDVTQLEAPRNPEKMDVLYDNLKGIRDVTSQWARWPKSSDLKDAAMGLIRIGQIYRLYPRTSLDHNSHFTLTNTNGLDLFQTDNISSSSNSSCRSSSSSNSSSISNSSCSSRSGSSDGSSNYNKDKSNEYDSDSACPESNNNSPRKQVQSKPKSSDNIAKEATVPRKTDSKKACEYDYTALDVEDFMFITNFANDQSLKEDASHWYDLVMTSIQNHKGDHPSILKEAKKLERTLKTIKKPKMRTDRVMDNYVILCRNAVQSSWPYPSPSPTPYPLSCTWRQVYPYLRYKVELLHTSPDIYQFHDVISLPEMDHIKQRASLRLSPSTLDIDKDSKNHTRYWRVSQTAWFTDETPVLQSLSRRVGQLTGLATGLVSVTRDEIDSDFSEPLQVVNYGLGGLYGPHLDTLLGDVLAGGATVFPLIGVDVRPIKGSAILWYNLLRNGQTDKNTVHAGCPVLIGDKWVANKWVRETAQWKTRPCLLDDTV